jgi:TRAP-type C4-dicarboxylate transport system permease small subunit
MTRILGGFISTVDAIMRVMRAVIAVLLVISVLLNFSNVIGRKFLNSPIVGAEEVMNFLMVAVVFLGAGVVAYDGTHINMEIVIDRFPPRLRDGFRALAQIAAIVIVVILVSLGIPIVEHLAQFDERSQAANVPLYIPQAMVPIGLTLLALGALARLAMLALPRDENPTPAVPET